MEQDTLDNKIIMSMDEDILLQLITISLEGTTFHNYNIDLFDLLNLHGFYKLHVHQYQEESESLAALKHYYITNFNKLPEIQTEDKKLWNLTIGTISEETIPQMVKNALTMYYDWETEVLEKLLTLRKKAKDKTPFKQKIQDVICEIDFLETLMNVLNEHSYNYESICEISNFLNK